jgi:replicative DNA helicase
MRQCLERHKNVNLAILYDSLTETERAEIGGAPYLGSLVASLPEKPDFDALLDILKEADKKRKYRATADALLSALELGEDSGKLDAILNRRPTEDDQPVDKTIKAACEVAAKNLDDIRNKGVDLHFGCTQLDDSLGGIRRKKLYTIGGRTSQGKTTVCANIIQDNLAQNKACKIYYNGFENVDELPIRLASISGNVRLDHFIKPHLLNDEQYIETLGALGELEQYNDRLLISFGDSVNSMRRVCKSYKPDIVIVDYIQRLAHKFDLGSSDRLSHAVGKAVSDLQDIAIEYNAAMFCCSQFKRSPYEGRGKEPSIEDLKESGDIENYSDNIILLWWPWRDTLDDQRFMPTEYRYLIRKNKLGPTVDIKARINLETLRISD